MGFDAINYLFYPQHAANKDLKKAFGLIKQGKYDDAIKVLTTAIHLVPEDGYLYANRGVAYHHQKEYTKAIRDYSAALERTIYDPADLYANRGVAHAQNGDDKAAIVDYTVALRLGLDLDRAIKTLEHRGYLLIHQAEWLRAEIISMSCLV